MNRVATRWRGKLPIPEHAHPLVRQLFREMNAQCTTIREVAERATFRAGTISDWRYCREPTLCNFVAALNVLGLDLKIVEKSGGAGRPRRTAA